MASKLEADMLFAIKVVGLPEPITEKHFDWCCEHSKKIHVPGGWCDECIAAGEPVTVMHRYRHGRAFRFDLCWPAQMLAVELDGATWAAGRHTRGAGFQSDAEKRNLAQLMGYRVLTFTRLDVTSGRALEVIEAALKQSKPA